jgi:hypothetical protein
MFDKDVALHRTLSIACQSGSFVPTESFAQCGVTYSAPAKMICRWNGTKSNSAAVVLLWSDLRTAMNGLM